MFIKATKLTYKKTIPFVMMFSEYNDLKCYEF